MKITRYLFILLFCYSFCFPIFDSTNTSIPVSTHTSAEHIYITYTYGANSHTLAVFDRTPNGISLVSCVPLSTHLIQELQSFGVDLGFNHLLNQGVTPEALCQMYTFCASEHYRNGIEKLPCFDRIAIQVAQQAVIDRDLANKMANILFDNGKTALEYYNQKAADALSRGIVIEQFKTQAQLLEEQQAERIKKIQNIFTSEKIAAEEAELTQLKKTLDQSQPAMYALREQVLNDLQIVKADKNALEEISYAVTPQAKDLAFRNQVNLTALQVRFGYAVQQDIHNAIVGEINKIASMPVSHNQEFVGQFKNQMVQRLNIALNHNEQGNIAQALKECADVANIYKYVQNIANGTIDYQQLYSPQSLNQLKADIDKKISVLTNRLDPKFFIADLAAGEVLPAKDFCKDRCRTTCLNRIQHHEQRAIRRHIYELSAFRNQISSMLNGKHTLSVVRYELISDMPGQSINMHITGNQLDHALCKQAVELRNVIALQAVGSEKNAMVILSDSLINLVKSGYCPGVCIEVIDVIAAHQSWPSQIQSSITQKINEDIDEIARDIQKIISFGEGFAEGFLEGGASIASVITHPENTPQELRDKIHAVGQLLHRTGSEMSQHIHDKYTAMTGATDQERKQAANRMLHRSQRMLLWSQTIYTKLQAMSARDWGHVAGRGSFDMGCFQVAGKALGAVNIGLQEARQAELVLQCERSVSQALESMATKLDTVTKDFARKAMAAAEPELVIAGTNIKNSWQALKQEAEQILGGSKATTIGNTIANNYQSMAKFVADSVTTPQLAAKYGPEIQKIISTVISKCQAIGLPIPDIDTFQHVISGHMENGSRLLRPKGILRSVFNTGEDWLQLGIETWEKGILESPGIKVYDFGRIIGRSLETGEQISKVKIVVKRGKWITIFPLETI